MTLTRSRFESGFDALRPLMMLVILLGFALTVSAREPDVVIDLWEGAPPGEPLKVGAEQDFTKPTDKLIAGRRIIKLGNVSKPQAHVFLPPKDKRNGTAVVICPGGGYSILAWDLEGTEVAEWLNTLGVTGIVLKYRVPTRDQKPAWMAPAQDIHRAMRIATHRGPEWGVAADRIGLLGFSAGGHAAAMAAIQQGERLSPTSDVIDKIALQVAFAVVIYPGGLIDNATGQLREEVKVTRETPPMFFAHAQDDGVSVENSVQLFRALKKAGVPSELHVYDAGGHGYGLRPVPELPVTTWPDRCADWLKRRGLLTQPKSD